MRPWACAPTNVRPVNLVTRIVLARTDLVAIWLDTLRAFPTGLCLSLHHLVAPRAPRSLSDRLDLDVRPPSYGANLLEFGVRFADGREISNREPLPVRPRDDGLFVSLRAGDGDETVWWIHPLAPPGPLTFWVAWERAGIPPTSAQIDARILREAADRAERLWP